MNLREAISKVDSTKPNGYSTEEKVAWLSYLDATIAEDVMNTHLHKVGVEFDPLEMKYETKYEDMVDVSELEEYSANNLDRELLVPYPYSVLYPAYLKMKIDEENGETTRYNNSAVLFNSYYEDYARWYNKHNEPTHKGLKIM